MGMFVVEHRLMNIHWAPVCQFPHSRLPVVLKLVELVSATSITLLACKCCQQECIL